MQIVQTALVPQSAASPEGLTQQPWWTPLVAGVFLVIGALIAFVSQQRTASLTAKRERQRMREELRIRQEIAWAELQSESLIGLQEALTDFFSACVSRLLRRHGLDHDSAEADLMPEARRRSETLAARLEDRNLAAKARSLRLEIYSATSEKTLSGYWADDDSLQELDERLEAFNSELAAAAHAVYDNVRQRLSGPD